RYLSAATRGAHNTPMAICPDGNVRDGKTAIEVAREPRSFANRDGKFELKAAQSPSRLRTQLRLPFTRPSAGVIPLYRACPGRIDPLLSAGPSDFIMIPRVDDRLESEKERSMSIDKSLRRKNSLQRARNVLTRGERIKTLMDEERWQEGRSPYN